MIEDILMEKEIEIVIEKSKTRLKKKRKRFSIVNFLVFLFVVSTAGFLVLLYGMSYIADLAPPGADIGIGPDIWTTLSKPGEVAFGSQEHMTILCLGVDQNWTDDNLMYTKGARSDTIFVISLDKYGSRAGVVSIPRDTWVYLGDEVGYEEKINSAFAVGGLALSRKVIEKFLGVKIDHYVILKVQATKKLVDAFGGLYINVEKDMDYDDNWGHLHIHLKAGPQRLNGEQAVGYARFRNDEEGDWGRIRRQQQVMQALVRELKTPANLPRLNKIAMIIKKNIETDMEFMQILDIAQVYKDFDRNNLLRGVITGTDDSIGGAAVVIPDEAHKKQVAQRVLKFYEAPEAYGYRVKVLNGCPVENLATEAAEKLKALGFKVVFVGNAEQTDLVVSEIIDHKGNVRGATLLEEVIGSSKILQGASQENPENADYTILLGSDSAQWLQAPY